jgi:hypothetical protein
MAIIYLLSIYLDKYCNVEGLHWFGGLKLMWIFHYLHRLWMEMYSKLFYTKYCLSNIFTIISDMELNFEKKTKKKTHCWNNPKIL